MTGRLACGCEGGGGLFIPVTVILRRTCYGNDGVGNGEDTALVVERLARVGTLVLGAGVPYRQDATSTLRRRGHL